MLQKYTVDKIPEIWRDRSRTTHTREKGGGDILEAKNFRDFIPITLITITIFKGNYKNYNTDNSHLFTGKSNIGLIQNTF